MIRFDYPDGDHCYRALHTVHAIFHDPDGRLIARAENQIVVICTNLKSQVSPWSKPAQR